MLKKIGAGAIVIAVIAALAYGLREKREITTSSSEAYFEYRKGVELANKFYFDEALMRFQRATQLDTCFAMAYCRQGFIHRNSGRIEEAQEAFSKAVECATNATEKEQLIIAFHNAHTNRDIRRADEVIEILARRYPKATEIYDYRVMSI